VKNFNMCDTESFTLDSPAAGAFTDTGTSAEGRDGPAIEDLYDSGSWARAQGEATMLEAAAAVASAAVATVAELNQSGTAPHAASLPSGNSSQVGESGAGTADAHIDRETYWDDLGEEVF
jgi:hypothetical protein